MAFRTAEILDSGGNSNPQTPSGVVDGNNATFTAIPPLNNLFVNEGFQTPGVDYTTSGTSPLTILFVVAPPKGSVIYAT